MDIYEIRKQLNEGKTIYEMPLRVTFYARVSTDKDEQINSLNNQISFYSDFIKQNSCWTYVDGYFDEGISGTSVEKRENFLRMVNDAKLGKFDFIITKEISRFSRNTIDSIKYTQQLLSNGVGVLFQSDNINTLSPDSELRLTIMSSIAQDEVRKLSERVKFGFKKSINNGTVLGSNNIWGYRKDKGKLVIDEEQAKIVRLIFELYVTEKMGIRRICEYLNEKGIRNSKDNQFAFSTVKNILVNPKYKGYYCGNKTHKIDYRNKQVKVFEESEWIMYKDYEKVPPIVSEELWDKANMILRKRSEKMSAEDKTSYQNKYAYSGKIICMEHKVPYYRTEFRYKTGNKELWQCKRYVEKGKEGCTSPLIYTKELDMIMKEICKELITEKERIINDLIEIYSSISKKATIKEDIAKILNEIESKNKMKDKLLEFAISGNISNEEFVSRNNKFNDELTKLQIHLEELKEEEIKTNDTMNTLDTIKKIIAKELDFEEDFNNDIVENLLERIEVSKTNDKNEFTLKVYLQVIDECREYRINRNGKNTSFCSILHI